MTTEWAKSMLVVDCGEGDVPDLWDSFGQLIEQMGGSRVLYHRTETQNALTSLDFGQRITHLILGCQALEEFDEFVKDLERLKQRYTEAGRKEEEGYEYQLFAAIVADGNVNGYGEAKKALEAIGVNAIVVADVVDLCGEPGWGCPADSIDDNV